jgi:hypothetical protein
VVATFRALADQLTAPVLMDAPDMSKFDRPLQLHCLFRALSEFQLKVRFAMGWMILVSLCRSSWCACYEFG